VIRGSGRLVPLKAFRLHFLWQANNNYLIAVARRYFKDCRALVTHTGIGLGGASSCPRLSLFIFLKAPFF
jgi:hypothetical protein